MRPLSKRRMGLQRQKLISNSIASQPVSRLVIGNGDQASENTLRLMRDIIQKSSQNMVVRSWAEKIIKNIPANDELGEAKAIFDFLRKNTKYVKDIDGIEFIRTPMVSLQMIEVGDTPSLDCDDLTTLSLALLKSIGYPVILRATAYKKKNFEHVYGLVRLYAKWYSFDLTKPYGLGWEGKEYKRVHDMEV